MKNPKATPPRQIPEYAGSMRSAEKLFGISRSELQRAKNSGCPDFTGNRVKSSVIGWLETNPKPEEEESGLDEKETLERLRLQKINRNLDLKYERENGSLVPRETAVAVQLQHIEIVQSVTKSFLPRDQYNAWIRQIKASLKGIEL